MPSPLGQFPGMIANRLSGPLFPNGFDKAMVQIRNPGPNNLDIVPLEASVTGGRAAWAWHRSGVLEFQERVYEEVLAAIVWLWGVKTFDKLYDKALEKFKPEINTSVDWSSNRWKSLALSPLERYTETWPEASKLLRYKYLGKTFSIAASLFLVALAIPWTNQKKTDWIIQHFMPSTDPADKLVEKTRDGPHGTSSHAVTPTDKSSTPFGTQGSHALLKNAYGGDTRLLPTVPPAENLPAAMRLDAAGNPVFSPSANFGRILTTPENTRSSNPQANPFSVNGSSASTVSGEYQHPYNLTPILLPPPPQASHPLDYFKKEGAPDHAQKWPERLASWSWGKIFGGLGAVAGAAVGIPMALKSGSMPEFSRNLIEGLARSGHLQGNIPYGDVLVVDTGITGGRMYMGGKRDFYEGLEYFNRDVMSLYFYLLSKPHIMVALNVLAMKTLQTSLRLDPIMAQELTDTLLKQAKAQALHGAQGATMTKHQLLTTLLGESSEALTQWGSKDAMHQYAQSMREVHPSNLASFWNRVSDELRVTLPDAAQAEAAVLTQKLKDWVAQKSSASAPLTTETLQTLLEAVREKRAFSLPGVSQPVVDDAVARALKWSAQFHMGTTTQKLAQQIPATLDATLLSGVEARIQQAARRDTLETMTAGLERIAQLIERRTILPVSAKGQLDELRQVLPWFEKASLRQISPGQLMAAQLNELCQAIVDSKKASVQEPMKQAAQQIQQALKGGQLDIEATRQLNTLLKEASGLPSAVHRLKGVTHDLLPFLNTQAGQTVELEQWVSQRVTQILQAIELPEPGRQLDLLKTYRDSVISMLDPGKQDTGLIRYLEAGNLEKNPGLVNKIEEMLYGGLVRDKALERLGLEVTSALPDSARGYFDKAPGQKTQNGVLRAVKRFVNPFGNRSESMQNALREYGEYLKKSLSHLDDHEAIAAEKLEELVKQYAQRSRNLNHISLLLALAGSIVGLAWIVPKVQYWITKHFTGRDTHPGILAARQKLQSLDHPMHPNGVSA